MPRTTNIIERAYQLAEACGSLEEIKVKLKQEGFASVEAHLAGKQIRSDIAAVLDRQQRLASPSA